MPRLQCVFSVPVANMHWLDGEIPTDCFRRVLSAFPGDHELRYSGVLPVQRVKARIVQAV